MPYPAGAPDDAIARIIAAKLSEERGRFYVENIPGATGAIGTSAVGKAAPDGCTLLIINQNFVIQPAVNAAILYDARAGFSAVTLLATAPETIAVHPSVAAKSVEELILLLKKSPGQFSYASPGYGSSPHLAAERLFKAAGVDVLHVPFQGGPPAVNATIGGHTQIVHLTLPIVAPLVRDGRLRMLAVADTKRLPDFPDVPTLAEAGYSGFDVGYWNGIVVPRGTPENVIKTLNQSIAHAVASPDVAKRLAELGFTVNATSPGEFAAHIEAQLLLWGTIAQQTNIKIN